MMLSAILLYTLAPFISCNELIKAIRAGNLDKAIRLFQTDVDFDGAEEDGTTPLLAALEVKMVDLANVLIAVGANVRASRTTGECALHVAVKNSLVSSVKLLLKGKAYVNATAVGSKYTALHYAARSDCPNIARLLIMYGADLRAFTADGETALHLAVMHGNVDVVIAILHGGALANVADKKIMDTPLHYVADYNCDVKFVDLLVKNDEKCKNARNLLGDTPLKRAIMKGHLNVARALLQIGCDVNVVDNLEKETALSYAVRNGTFEKVQLLLNHDADVNVENGEGLTSLKLAMRIGNAKGRKIGMALLKAGADPDTLDVDGSTLLHWAAMDNDLELAKLLLAKGARYDLKDKFKCTAIDLIRKQEYKEVFRCIVDAMPDADGGALNRLNVNGETPLHFSVRCEDPDLVRNLLMKGASPETTNDKGQTAKELAELKGHKNIVKIFNELKV